MDITKVFAREVLDSSGNPTAEVEIHCGTLSASASVPSGASAGSNESLELRDGEKRFLGKGARKAVDNVNRIIAPKILGLDCRQQELIDNIMIGLEGTENKSKLEQTQYSE
jgi:enolase